MKLTDSLNPRPKSYQEKQNKKKAGPADDVIEEIKETIKDLPKKINLNDF